MRQLHMTLITNKNTKRALEIISLLADSIYPISLSTLSEEVGVTPRTLISDINTLKDSLPDNWGLIGEKNKGYTLSYPNEYELALFKKDLLTDEVIFQLLNSIFNNELHSLHEWSDRLYISEYTFSRNLAPLKEVLANYNLTLSVSPVITIKGSEIDIRLFFFMYFYEAHMTPHSIEPTTKIKDFYHYCLDYLDKTPHLNPIVQFNKSVYWIMVILERIKHGHFVSLEDSLISKQKESETYYHFNNLWQNFSEKFEVSFPEDETIFFSLININNYYFDYEHLPQSTGLTNTDLSDIELDALLSQLTHIFTIDETMDDKITLAYKSYIKNVNHLTKLSPLFQLNNAELNDYVTHKHGFVLSKCLNFISQNDYFSQHMRIEFPMDIAVNLTLITSTFINLTHYQNKSILFILEGNQNLLLYIQAQTQRFSDQGVTTHFISHMEITKDIATELNVDLIVTNYENFYLDFSIPVMRTSNIPTENDWNTIGSLIFNSRHK